MPKPKRPTHRPLAVQPSVGEQNPDGGIARALWADAIALRIQGATLTEIARALRKSVSAVSDTFRHPEVIATLERHQELALRTARVALQGHAGMAIQLLADMVRDESTAPRLRLQAALELLDRAGLAKHAAPLVTVDARSVSADGSAPLITPAQAEALTDDQLERLFAHVQGQFAPQAPNAPSPRPVPAPERFPVPERFPEPDEPAPEPEPDDEPTASAPSIVHPARAPRRNDPWA